MCGGLDMDGRKGTSSLYDCIHMSNITSLWVQWLLEHDAFKLLWTDGQFDGHSSLSFFVFSPSFFSFREDSQVKWIRPGIFFHEIKYVQVLIISLFFLSWKDFHYILLTQVLLQPCCLLKFIAWKKEMSQTKPSLLAPTPSFFSLFSFQPSIVFLAGKLVEWWVFAL